MKKRSSLAVDAFSTLDELKSARLVIDDLIDKRTHPAPPKQVKRRPRSLNTLGLPRQVVNRLRMAGIKSVDALVRLSAPTLLTIPGLGLKSVRNIQTALADHELALSEEQANEQVDGQGGVAG
jgi:DNA-directed RNA polymerase alpha subunit